MIQPILIDWVVNYIANDNFVPFHSSSQFLEFAFAIFKILHQKFRLLWISEISDS